MITITDVREYIFNKHPQFVNIYGQNVFSEMEEHYSFERLADFLIEYGFEKDDTKLTHTIVDYILLLLKDGDEHVVSCVYASFIEGVVDRGYKKHPQLKEIIQLMPEEVIDFIKKFFIKDVHIALGLNKK